MRKVDRTDLATIILGGLAGAANPYLGVLAAAGVYVAGKSTDPEKMSELVPTEVKNLLAVISIAHEKLFEDLRNSVSCSATELLFRERENSQSLLTQIGISQTQPVQGLEITKFRASSGWAGPDTASESRLREHSEFSVSAAGISVAACAALKAIQRQKIKAELSLSEGSGKEQAEAGLTKDFIIIADAPFLLEQSNSRRDYRRLFEVNREVQTVFKKNGRGQKGRIPTVYIYPSSSAEHQLRMAKSPDFSSPLPDTYNEDWVIDIADYPTVIDNYMKPGDFIFSWEPLSKALRKVPSLTEYRSNPFPIPVSLYGKAEHFEGDNPLAIDFGKVFLNRWKWTSNNPTIAWASLLSDSNFFLGLKRGAGLST